MKYLNILIFLSVVIGSSIVLAQESTNFHTDDWMITIQKRPVVGTNGLQATDNSRANDFPLIAEKKRTDQEPDVSFMECPDALSEDASLKNLIDYVNLVVDHFNCDQIEELEKTLTDKWEEGKSCLKYRYAKYKPSSVLYSIKQSDIGEIIPPVPLFIMVESGVRIGPSPKAYPPREIEDGGTGDRIGYMSIFFVVFAGGKVQSAGGYFPLLNEEYCVLLGYR